MAISTSIANSACERFKDEDVVCPLKLRGGLFTTAAIDNIDHNPSATTAKDSFHGTGISLFQHPTPLMKGVDRGSLVLDNGETTALKKNVFPLPEFYTSIPPVIVKKDKAAVPESKTQIKMNTHHLKEAYIEELR